MIVTTDSMTAELFLLGGIWHKPVDAERVDVILLGGHAHRTDVAAPAVLAAAHYVAPAGGSGGGGSYAAIGGQVGGEGELTAGSYPADALPDTLEVHVGAGGLALVLTRHAHPPADASAPDGTSLAEPAGDDIPAELAALRHDLNRALAALHLRSSRP